MERVRSQSVKRVITLLVWLKIKLGEHSKLYYRISTSAARKEEFDSVIDVKQAVRSAIRYVNDLYEQKEPTDFMLEEVELSDDGKYWLITISFPQYQRQTNPLVALTTPNYEQRIYKTIKVHTENGQAISMKIRQV